MAASAFLTTFQMITANDPIMVVLNAEVDPFPITESWIALAVVRLDVVRWGSLHVQGVAYLAAHMYAVGPGAAAAGGAGLGGSVAERRARNWALRFQAASGASSSGDASLKETKYGLEFLQLRQMTRGPLLARPSRT